MARGHCKPPEGTVGMGKTVTYIGERGYGFPDVGPFIPGHSKVRPALWCRDLGSDPAHQKTTGGFPPQGGAEDSGETTTATGGKDLGLHPTGGGYTGGGHVGDGELYFQALE